MVMHAADVGDYGKKGEEAHRTWQPKGGAAVGTHATRGVYALCARYACLSVCAAGVGEAGKQRKPTPNVAI